MKTKNFPAKKLKLQLVAQDKDPKKYEKELDMARNVRTKKHRTAK